MHSSIDPFEGMEFFISYRGAHSARISRWGLAKSYQGKSESPIDNFSIAHNSLCLPPTIVVKFSLEVCIFAKAFHSNSLCKIWGANRVHYGQLENREYRGVFHSTKNSGNSWWRANGTFSGISFRNFGCTSRACPNIPENSNNRKILFHSTIPSQPSLYCQHGATQQFQCSKTWKAKTCSVGEITARPNPLPIASSLANKRLASFFRRSKMTLEFVWKIRYRTFKVFANSILISPHITTEQRWKKIDFNFRVIEQLQQKKHIFPCFTNCTFAWNSENDCLGRVGPTNRKIPFHSSYGIPGLISNRNFWSNGKRPR